MSRRRRHSAHTGGDQSWKMDLPFNVMFVFIITTVLLFFFIKVADVTSVPEYEALKVTTTWDTCLTDNRNGRYPGLSEADVDLHMLGVLKTPDGEVRDRIGFNTPDRKTKYFILNQDDKGSSGYITRDSNGQVIKEDNKEIISSALNELVDGWYFVNLHLYDSDGELNKSGKICNDVEVVIYKGHKNKEKVICDLKYEARTQAELTIRSQELTVCQFQIKDGDFVPGSNENIVDYPFIITGRGTTTRR